MKHWIQFRETLKTAVQQWFVEQCRDNSTRFYCYYQPGNGSNSGMVLITPENPGDGWTIATPNAMRRDLTVDANTSILSGVFYRLPILPTS